MQTTSIAEVLTKASEQANPPLTEVSISVAMLIGLLKGVLVFGIVDASEKATYPVPVLKEILTILLATSPELGFVLITLLLHSLEVIEAHQSVNYIVLSLSSATITTLILLASYYKEAQHSRRSNQ